MSDTKKNKPTEGQTPAESTNTPAADPNTEAGKIIAEAKERAAEIVAAAEAEAKKKAEAEAKKKAETEAKKLASTKADPMEELVDYTAPLLPNLRKRDILVAVNGETLRIKRGVPVKIKRKFYEVLQNAAAQEFAALETRQEIQKQGEKALASM